MFYNEGMKARFDVFQTIPTNPYEFTGVSAAELGYDPALLDQRYIEWIDKDSGQRLGIYETQPRRENGEKLSIVIIMLASHDYRLEPLWMRSMDILSVAH